MRDAVVQRQSQQQLRPRPGSRTAAALSSSRRCGTDRLLLPLLFTSTALLWRHPHLPLCPPPTRLPRQPHHSTQQQDESLCASVSIALSRRAPSRCLVGRNDAQRLLRQRKIAQKRRLQKRLRHRSGLYGARPPCSRLHRPPLGRLAKERSGEDLTPATIDRTLMIPLMLRLLSWLRS